MSSYFNQTNISPRTPFSGGGGNAVFTKGIAISDNGANTKFLQIDPHALWSQPVLAVEDRAVDISQNMLTQPLCANPFFAFSWDGSNATSQKSGSYEATQIRFQGNAGSGSGSVLLTVNDTAMNSLPTDLAFQMSCMSSIQCGTYLINAEKMCSTMKGYGWA